MMKLSSGKEVCSFLRVVGTEDVKVSFNFLIGLFRLSICLGVISGGEFDVILEEACEFSGEGRRELWSSVRDQ